MNNDNKFLKDISFEKRKKAAKLPGIDVTEEHIRDISNPRNRKLNDSAHIQNRHAIIAQNLNITQTKPTSFRESHWDFYRSLKSRHKMDEQVQPINSQTLSVDRSPPSSRKTKSQISRNIIAENTQKTSHRRTLKEYEIFKPKKTKLSFKDYDGLYFKVLEEDSSKIDGAFGDFRSNCFIKYRSKRKQAEQMNENLDELQLFLKDHLYEGLPLEIKSFKDMLRPPKLQTIEDFKTNYHLLGRKDSQEIKTGQLVSHLES